MFISIKYLEQNKFPSNLIVYKNFNALIFNGVSLSQSDKKSYIKKIVELARSNWGADSEEFGDHIKFTAHAIYNINNYSLEPKIQPVIMLRHDEEDESL
jgi:hypothetical protein